MNDPAGWHDRWLATPDDMIGWSPGQWLDWWVDGLQLWFSHAPIADREMAFAPFRVLADRELLEDTLSNALRSIYDPDPFANHDPDEIFACRDSIEAAAVQALRLERSVSGRVAATIIGVFVRLRPKKLAEMMIATLSAYKRGLLDDISPKELASRIAYSIYRNVSDQEIQLFRPDVEEFLGSIGLYRPILFYCARAYTDFFECIDKFSLMWSPDTTSDSADIWEDVASQLKIDFGPTVGEKVRALLEQQDLQTGGKAIGYAAATQLAPHLGIAGTLPGLLKETKPAHQNDQALRGRSLREEEEEDELVAA